MIDVGGSVGNYVVRSKLGEGGMGIVWLAEHPLIGKRVAIKVIHPNYARNPEAVSRFFTEAQAVNRVGHPNIVDITDFGQSPAGESYFVMEFLAGQSLADRMKAGGLDLRRAVHVAMQTSDALAASHAAGILHRDLKPDNIYLVKRGHDPDFVKVLDFGLAKLTGAADKAAGSQHKTRTGSMMGTPYYMAPEQCAGKADIDARADIYSLGVILFELCTGQVPFPGEGYGEIIVKHMTQPAPHVRETNPAIPEWLDAIVDRCLAKDREHRVQSMAELGTLLADQHAHLPGAPLARPTTTAGGSHPPPAGLGAGTMPAGLGVAEPVRPVSTMNLATGETAATPPGTRRSKGLVIAAAAAAVAGGGVFAVLALGGDGSKARGAAGGELAGKEAVVPPAAVADAAPAAGEPAHDHEEDGHSHVRAPDSPIVPPPPTETVAIAFAGRPAGVKITLPDGTVVCPATPCTWTTPKSAQAVTLTYEASGYTTRQEALTPDKDARVRADLKSEHRHREKKKDEPGKDNLLPMPF